MSGAPGTGGEVHSGGDGDGDSAGDGDSSGGDGDGDTISSGGRTLGGGGEPGVGGQLIDAVGGDDGSGGENAGGGSDSGGDSPGGGGAPAGGDTGAGGFPGGSTRLVINEMRLNPSGFVEIYNASNQTLDLTHFAVTTGTDEPNWAAACVLSGSLAPAGCLEVTSGSACRGQTSCIKDCTWTLSVGDRAYVLYAEQQTFDQIIDDRTYPSNVTVAIGQSYSATSDGSSTFAPREQSPGLTNGEQ
jgi:hypothetical protein